MLGVPAWGAAALGLPQQALLPGASGQGLRARPMAALARPIFFFFFKFFIKLFPKFILNFFQIIWFDFCQKHFPSNFSCRIFTDFEELELDISGGDGKRHLRMRFTVSYYGQNVTS
jgi:hypothetical protein